MMNIHQVRSGETRCFRTHLMKVIAKGGDVGKKEKLVFDLQTGTLTVESEPDSSGDRQVIEGMASSGWFAWESRSF